MDDLVCSRCGHNITEDDDDQCITRMFNKITDEDVLFCPACTLLFNYLTDMFIHNGQKMKEREVD